MTLRLLLSGAAAGALAIASVSAEAATGPSPDALLAALPDPVAGSWTEAEIGASGTLEGPIDVATLTSYYETFNQSESWIHYNNQTLIQNGFVGGYGRQWYRPGTRDELFESLFVFATAKGAKAVQAGDKMRNTQSDSFKTFFDPGVAAPAYAMTTSGDGLQGAFVSLVRGNAMYAISRYSGSELSNDEVVAQARKLVSVAPTNFAVTQRPATIPPLSPSVWLVIVAALWILIALGAILAVAAIAAFAPRRRLTSPTEQVNS